MVVNRFRESTDNYSDVCAKMWKKVRGILRGENSQIGVMETETSQMLPLPEEVI